MRLLSKLLLFALVFALICAWAGWALIDAMPHLSVQIDDAGVNIAEIGTGSLVLAVLAIGLGLCAAILVAALVVPFALVLAGAWTVMALGLAGLVLAGVLSLVFWPLLVIAALAWWWVRRHRTRVAVSPDAAQSRR